MKKIFSFALATCLAFLAALPSALAQTAESEHNLSVSKQLEIFFAAYAQLEESYVDTLNAEKHIGGALQYMLSQIDPYTVYYTEDETSDFRTMTQGKYAGVGARVQARKDLNRCIFFTVFEKSPAAVAGIRNGDVILAIDGVDVGEIGTQSAADYTESISKKLRGDAGTKISIKVRRHGQNKDLTFRFERRVVEIPSVDCTQLLADTVGYISVSDFNEGVAREVRTAFVDLKKRGARRLLIDLRENPGGIIGEAIDLVSLFLPKGSEVVSLRGRQSSQNQTYKTSSEPLDLDMPIVVMVDENSASAAEIVAGTLQDYDRAVIIGERTYGKGLVQETHQLPYNTMLKVTASKYYIPSGRCIQAYKFDDGEPVHLPDSLAKAFTTAAGRVVYDGGGIAPDVIAKADSLPTVLYSLVTSDEMYDFVVDYRSRHQRVDSPETFVVSDADYADFCAYLRDHHFTYEPRTKMALDVLRIAAARDGYSERLAPEIEALENRIADTLDADLQAHKNVISRYLGSGIMNDYYFDRGGQLFLLRFDSVLEEAVKVLSDAPRYAQLLSAPANAAADSADAPKKSRRK